MAYGPMSTPRRPAPRSIGTPTIRISRGELAACRACPAPTSLGAEDCSKASSRCRACPAPTSLGAEDCSKASSRCRACPAPTSLGAEDCSKASSRRGREFTCLIVLEAAARFATQIARCDHLAQQGWRGKARFFEFVEQDVGDK